MVPDQNGNDLAKGEKDMLSDTIEVNVGYDENGNANSILVGFEGDYKAFEFRREADRKVVDDALEEVRDWIGWLLMNREDD